MSIIDKRPHYTSPVHSLCLQDCEQLILLALQEDAPNGDITSEAILDVSKQGKACIVAQEDGRLCGLAILPFLFDLAHQCGCSQIDFHTNYSDGCRIHRGDKVLSLSGSLLSLLRLERVILNFLQYLSGIASHTANVVQKAGDDIVVLDTRKTLPGFRRLAKYAVYCGSATNHRIHLSDMAMIKDNHILAAGGVRQAVQAVQKKLADSSSCIPIEVEVASFTELKQVLDLGVDVILLDNMQRDDIIRAKQMVEDFFSQHSQEKKPFLEVSGNWNIEKIEKLRGLGHIGVSMGSLTHSSRFLDLSMELYS